MDCNLCLVIQILNDAYCAGIKVCENMLEILLMLQVCLAEDLEIEYVLCGAPSRSSAMISSASGWSLTRMSFNMTLPG